MEVDNADLLGHGWRPFVSRDDEAVIGRMLVDAAAGRPSQYDVCAEKVNGERLYLEVQTLAVIGQRDDISTAGRVILHAWESPRTRVFLRTMAVLVAAIA